MNDSQVFSTNPRDPVNITLVLLGPPGSGKSETANTILGNKIFHTAHQSRLSTTNPQRAFCKQDEIRLSIIDTPGIEKIIDFTGTINYLQDNQIENYVFGITLRVGRFTSRETETIHSLFQDDKYNEYLKCRTFVIFTNTYDLAEYGKQLSEDDFERWLENAQDILKLITEHDLKYCTVENGAGKIGDDEKKEQSRCLIKMTRETFANRERLKEKLTKRNDTDYEHKLEEKMEVSVRELIKIACTKNSVDQIYKILKDKKVSMSQEDTKKAVEDNNTSKCILM